MPYRVKNTKLLLQIIAIGHIGVGVLLPILAESIIFVPYVEHLRRVFGVSDSANLELARFLIGLFGPTIASWGILFLLAVNSAFSRPSRQGWWFMVMASLVWAPYDSGISLLNGVYYNVFIDAVIFPFIIVPLLIVKGHFNQVKPY